MRARVNAAVALRTQIRTDDNRTAGF
jgi:hypothetical protein